MRRIATIAAFPLLLAARARADGGGPPMLYSPVDRSVSIAGGHGAMLQSVPGWLEPLELGATLEMLHMSAD